MVATLLATSFAGIALFAVAAMIHAWRAYGARFADLRRELRTANGALTVHYAWRDTGARATAVIYRHDFKAKADGLPFHPELKPELRAAA